MTIKRAGVLIAHISITAILFLTLTQFLVLQTLRVNVTGPIVLACTVAALGGAIASGRLRPQWGPGLLFLFMSLLAFRDTGEITLLTESYLNLILPVVVVALCVRIDVEILLRCLAVAGVVLVITMAFMGETINARLTLSNQNPIWMARMAGMALLAVLFRPPTRFRIINWAIAASLLWTMWLTGSRGPVVAVWAGIVFYQLLRAKGRMGPWLAVGTLVISAAAEAALGGAALPERANGEVNTEWRLAAWAQALRLWSSRPLLGYGSAVDTQGVFGVEAYPHNAFLEILLQAGVFGLMAMAALMWLTWRSTESAKVRAIFVSVVIFSATSGSVWAAYELWMFALLRVAAHANREAPDPPGTRSNAPPGQQQLSADSPESPRSPTLTSAGSQRVTAGRPFDGSGAR